MSPISLVLLAAGVTVAGEWAGGNSAGTLAKAGVALPGNRTASPGSVIVGGFISAIFISILSDAGPGPRKVAFGLASLILATAVLGPGTAIFKGLGLYPGSAPNPGKPGYAGGHPLL